MAWEILNANFYRWGQETYPTKEAAEEYLREFWRGVHGVRLERFTIQKVEERPTPLTFPQYPIS